MKKSLILLICLFSVCLDAKFSSVDLKAESAILINADNGRIVYEKNAYTKRFPASLTKIATTMYALHKAGGKLDHPVKAEFDAIASISEKKREKTYHTLPAYWLVPGTSHIGIKKDEVLSLRDLLYGTMIASGGDAANVVGQFIGDSIPHFVQELNVYLKSIGCTNTTFHNPHGLHHPHHITTAYDLGIMTREAMKNPRFREIVKTVRYKRPKTNKQEAVTLVQTNRLLKKGKFYYPKAIGVKTGYTSPAKHTLVAAAEHEGRTLIAVLLKYQNRDDMFIDAKKIFEEAFKEKQLRQLLLKKGSQKTTLNITNAQTSIQTFIEDDIAIDYYESEKPNVKCFIHWDDVELPITKGQRLGEYRVVDETNLQLCSQPIFALEDVDASLFYRIKTYATHHKSLKWIASIVVLLLFGGLALELRR